MPNDIIKINLLDLLNTKPLKYFAKRIFLVMELNAMLFCSET